MRSLALFFTATRYALVEHGRNRLAVVLMLVFVPLWVTLAHLTVGTAPARFRLHATGELLSARSNELTQITGAMNAITAIVGFMMFASTFSNGAFDQRLAMAGFPRGLLVLAKVACLMLASAALVGYATALLCCFWTPRQPGVLAAALFCTAMTYGAFGVALGSLLRREVEGMFAIVMLTVTDIILQNPVASASSDDDIVRFLPSYGAMQAAVAAGFSSTALPAYLLMQLAWFAVAAALCLLAFHQRTRVFACRQVRGEGTECGSARV
ncbi:ABC transporter permease [Streptomyces sp. NPDC055189]